MNNYCTNCGKKLGKDDLVCQICNTPIVDLPHNYYYKSSKEKKSLKKLLIIVSIVLLISVIIPSIIVFINKNKAYKIQKKYIEPYLEKNYHNSYSSIEFEGSGKCIIGGECSRNSIKACDISPGRCKEYIYLEDNNCKSYYFHISGKKAPFVVTAVKQNNKFYVVTGKNINGTDYINDTSNYYNESSEKNIDKHKYDENEEQVDKYENDYNVKHVEKYPYESDYYDFNSKSIDNKIYLDNNGMDLHFFTGILYDKSKIYISGNISNPMYYKGSVEMITNYYDKDYNKIGSCNDTIELLGEGYSYISFSCDISEQDLINDKGFDDIMYYKVNILTPNIIK